MPARPVHVELGQPGDSTLELLVGLSIDPFLFRLGQVAGLALLCGAGLGVASVGRVWHWVVARSGQSARFAAVIPSLVTTPVGHDWRVSSVTMVFGEIGAGKTTYARTLEARGVVRLSLDEWTIAATGDPVHVSAEVVERLLDQLMNLWPHMVRAGVSVVLDFGFWDRPRRDEVRRVAAELGANINLVHVRCPMDERRTRCVGRSSVQDGSYAIDEGAFEWITAHKSVDPLGTDEPHQVVDTA